MTVRPSAYVSLAFLVGVSSTPAVADPGKIGGHIDGDTARAPALNFHPDNRDDFNQTTTIPITFLSTSDLITKAAEDKKFDNYSFEFAGAKDGVGENFTPIDPSDFFIKIYQPWVVNNTFRQVHNQDAGGVTIAIFYAPTARTDPRKVNFVQAVSVSDNGEDPTTAMDTAGNTPYYNETGVAGILTKRGKSEIQTGTIPLNITDTDKSAWMLDVPYACETGHQPAENAGVGCPEQTDQNDDTIESRTATFETFIEADQTIGDHEYNVLYGGIRWGYTWTTIDDYNQPPGFPEPGTLALIGAGMASLGALKRWRWGASA